MLQFLYNSKLIIKNKYFKWYTNIINNAKNKSNLIVDDYHENHHIIPRAIFNNIISINENNVNLDDKNNIISLTAKEHFIAHLLLSKFTTGVDQRKMIHAMYGLLFQRSAIQNRYVTLNSRTYEYIKKEFIKSVSGDNHWTKHVSKELLSEIAIKREANYTPEQKTLRAEKQSQRTKGIPKTEKWFENAPKAMKGKKKTITQKLLDARKKIKEEYALGLRINPMQDVIREKSPCPHCNKLVDVANMQRWHGDNCKFKK